MKKKSTNKNPILEFLPAILIFAVIIIIIAFSVYEATRIKYTVAGLGVSRNRLFPQENIEVSSITYATDLLIINPDTITADGYNLNYDVLSPQTVSSHLILKDKDNQSSFYTLGSSQFGLITKGGQMFGVVSLNNSQMRGGYIITGDTSSFKENTDISTIIGLKNVTDAEFYKTIEYNSKKYDIVKVITSYTIDYLYIDKGTKRATQSFQISDNSITHYIYSDYTGEIEFFENIENYPFYTKDCEEFAKEYEQYVYASILLAGSENSVDLSDYLPTQEELEDRYD